MLLMVLALAPISRAESYLNFLSEKVMPLHDKLFETNFVVSQDPPMCEKNKLIRGFSFRNIEQFTFAWRTYLKTRGQEILTDQAKIRTRGFS